MAVLSERARQLDVSLTEIQLEQIKHYCLALAEYNAHTNLVSDASPQRLVLDHILDSLTLVKFARGLAQARERAPAALRLIDIGSGAGLPGLILAISMPEANITLLDSIGKKVKFLQSFIAAAGLSDRVQAIAGRAELLGHQKRYRERFDVATARAVGSFALVAELALPLLRVGGRLCLQKSLSQLDDVSGEATQVLPKLGGLLTETAVLDACVLGKERVIFVVEKASKTAPGYPRTWAQIKNQPLATLPGDAKIRG